MSEFTINRVTKQDELTREWDRIAAIRHAQQISGKDTSFNAVLKPAILQRIGTAQSVLDAGCGTGILTNDIASLPGVVVTGVDPSPVSIELARRFSNNSATETHVSTLENWSRRYDGTSYDLITANMVLMDTLDLSSFLISARHLLKRGGRLVATVVHPNFWPRYWGYEDLPDFDYLKTSAITGRFKIGQQTTNLSTTHIHRPLADYVRSITSAGFALKEVTEMYGAERRLPFEKRYPRFLLLEAFTNG
ncbi:hypothetical protein C5C55_09065 [Rathayibacter sp. AY1C2]|uniref:class I SAM-dependent methyltransferase n=1 Tax=unclassified Rathayibacter TaxID=2609250 RepID=UPI000CE79D75|nr:MULTISPECIES: class I SAM-dependent methyltransferase [unclassified Rathayibacter]PPF56196.1 hypothetical protein C5C55_09065 [Rathayibacter sp. AY1C2]PPG61442.1 hypothetical protein C5C69_07515 [Rathayibacter sp. AY1C7]PPH56513.1 hypothetical protein C5C67_01770 [Rathayibacter sp. AY1E1]